MPDETIPQSLEEFSNADVESSADARLGMTERAMRRRLDKLDHLLQYDDYTLYEKEDLASARECVQYVMEDLRDNQALDSILIDRDVHNIIHYIRLTKDKFMQAPGLGKKPRSKAASKKTTAQAISGAALAENSELLAAMRQAIKDRISGNIKPPSPASSLDPLEAALNKFNQQNNGGK